LLVVASATLVSPLVGEDLPTTPELVAEPPPPVGRAALEPNVELAVHGMLAAVPPPARFVPVSGDVPAFVAPAPLPQATARAIVYLHGMCGDPARAAEWAQVAQRHGTLIALRAENPCPGQVGHYWRGDATYLDYRIKKAIRSVADALDLPLDETDVVLIGYSQGAQRAEDLAWVFPERYSRLALLSGPAPPRTAHVKRTRALAIARGEREYQRPFRAFVARLAPHHSRLGYFEFPGARHGELGDAAPRVMGELFEHLTD
jgi:predicted esterase